MTADTNDGGEDGEEDAITGEFIRCPEYIDAGLLSKITLCDERNEDPNEEEGRLCRRDGIVKEEKGETCDYCKDGEDGLSHAADSGATADDVGDGGARFLG